MPDPFKVVPLILVALAACSRPEAGADHATGGAQPGQAGGAATAQAPGTARAAADDAPYYTKLPLNEFMPHVMQYAGDGIWKRQGYISDRSGEHSLFPKNDQEWEDGESAALALAEMTNVLLIPGRRVADPAWDKAVLAVRAVALKAAAAAEKKDPAAWFAAGGELDEACDVCHVRFDPSFKSSGPPR